MTDSIQPDSAAKLAALRRRVAALEKQLTAQQAAAQKTTLQQTGSGGMAVGAGAGDLLSQLGDPHFAANAWHLPAEPLLGFVEIPPGPFTMGRNPALAEDVSAWEHPLHKVNLPTYYIAR